MAILELNQNWGFQQTNKPVTYKTKLGDGYSFDTIAPNSYREEWSITGNNLDDSEVENVTLFIENAAGVTSFQWRPNTTTAYKNYWCTDFSLTETSPNQFQISLKLQEAK